MKYVHYILMYYQRRQERGAWEADEREPRLRPDILKRIIQSYLSESITSPSPSLIPMLLPLCNVKI